MSKNLQSKINDRTAVIGIIGLGYVGLPLAVEFANNSFTVIGIDIDTGKVEQINRGENYIADVSDDNLKQLVSSKIISATTDFSVLTKIDAVIICVPTPLNKLKDPDVSYILSVLDQLTKYVHSNMLISLESTTYPGTTRELILPALEKTNLTVGEHYYLPWELEQAITQFVEHFNNHRYHESLENVTPADMYYGRQRQIINQRERIKKKTLNHRKLANMKTNNNQILTPNVYLNF